MKMLFATAMALSPVAAFATSVVSHRVYDSNAANFFQDSAVANVTLNSGHAVYQTDGASFGGNFGGATVYSEVDSGAGYLKSYSKVTAADGRDGGQSIVSMGFSDSLTFSGASAGTVTLTAHVEGTIAADGTTIWPYGGTTTPIYDPSKLSLIVDVPEANCPNNAVRGFVFDPSYPGGQRPAYLGCQAFLYLTPNGSATTPMLTPSQSYDATLAIEFFASPGDIVNFSMGYGIRNRLEPFRDETGAVNPNRGMAAVVADFSHTVVLQNIQTSNGLSVSAGAGPLTVNGGNLTYQAVADLAEVPEPAMLGLFGLGAGALAIRRRFKR